MHEVLIQPQPEVEGDATELLCTLVVAFQRSYRVINEQNEAWHGWSIIRGNIHFHSTSFRGKTLHRSSVLTVRRCPSSLSRWWWCTSKSPSTKEARDPCPAIVVEVGRTKSPRDVMTIPFTFPVSMTRDNIQNSFLSKIKDYPIHKSLEKPPLMDSYDGTRVSNDHVDGIDILLEFRNTTGPVKCKLFDIYILV